MLAGLQVQESTLSSSWSYNLKLLSDPCCVQIQILASWWLLVSSALAPVQAGAVQFN